MTMKLPYDVLGEIINHLSDDKHSLRACSLICKATVPLCRRHIFSEINLRKDVRSFADLLDRIPETVNRVRTLRLTFGDLQYENDAVECCQSLLKLNGLHIVELEFHHASSREEKFLEDIKLVLFHLLSLPSVSTLELNCEGHYDSTACRPAFVYLARIRNLKTLILNSDSFDIPHGVQPSFTGPSLGFLDLSYFPLGKLHIVKQYITKHVFDLSLLETLKIGGRSKDERVAVQDIIQSCVPTLRNLTCYSCAPCPLQLEGMPGLPFLRVFNLDLCWETAWVTKSDLWVQKLANQHVTTAEIQALFNVLSNCPELNEINISIHFGNTTSRDPRQFYNSVASVVDWKRCLKMCKLMDASLSGLQSEKLELVSFTLHMESLEVGGDGVVVRRFFPFLSARGILRVSAISEEYRRPIIYVERDKA